MQKFMNFRTQTVRNKIMRIAGLMGIDEEGEKQNDVMFAAISYYMKHPEKIEADLISYSSSIPDLEEGREKNSQVRNRQNRRKGEG